MVSHQGCVHADVAGRVNVAGRADAGVRADVAGHADARVRTDVAGRVYVAGLANTGGRVMMMLEVFMLLDEMLLDMLLLGQEMQGASAALNANGDTRPGKGAGLNADYRQQCCWCCQKWFRCRREC